MVGNQRDHDPLCHLRVPEGDLEHVSPEQEQGPGVGPLILLWSDGVQRHVKDLCHLYCLSTW